MKNFVTIPDPHFRANLKEQFPEAFNLEDKMDANNSTVKVFEGTIDASHSRIASLEGIEYFPDLTGLFCDHNKLRNIDVSKNKMLAYFRCNDNELASIDVSKNTDLCSFFCDGNELASIDVSKNTMLAYFSCAHNRLRNIDVSNNTQMLHFNCSYNQLTSVDVSKNKMLFHFNRSNNPIKKKKS